VVECLQWVEWAAWAVWVEWECNPILINPKRFIKRPVKYWPFLFEVL
jgi:hypothetical protein